MPATHKIEEAMPKQLWPMKYLQETVSKFALLSMRATLIEILAGNDKKLKMRHNRFNLKIIQGVINNHAL